MFPWAFCLRAKILILIMFRLLSYPAALQDWWFLVFIVITNSWENPEEEVEERLFAEKKKGLINIQQYRPEASLTGIKQLESRCRRWLWLKVMVKTTRRSPASTSNNSSSRRNHPLLNPPPPPFLNLFKHFISKHIYGSTSTPRKAIGPLIAILQFAYYAFFATPYLRTCRETYFMHATPFLPWSV